MPQRRWLATAALAAAGVVARPGAAEPRVACTAALVGGRALVDVTLDDFFDRDLLRVVRLGLVGNLRIEMTLVRARPLWWDDRVTTFTREVRLAFVRPSGPYVLDATGPVADPAHLVLQRQSVWPGGTALPRGSYSVEVRAHLEVVTAGSLGKVAAWIAGGERAREADRSTLTRLLLANVAGDLRRSASTACAAAPAR